MAANGDSEIHVDGYQSDTNQISGPLGRGLQVLSTEVNADCASVAFDRQGRIVSVCVGISGPRLYLFDPHSLATLASFPLPVRAVSPKILNPFQDFGSGGYFYLDNEDRMVIPTTDHHVYVIAETAGSGGPGFALQHDYDLSRLIPASDEITSALPDWSGRLWVESFDGKLVTLDPATGSTHLLDLHEETENSFAVDETGGVYVVSIAALYRLDARPDGTPRVSWREVYPNSGIHEPGQVDAGSGTTPTVQGSYVTITDNANPLDIVVYRRAVRIRGSRRVCVQPIFSKDQSADENSLIGDGNVMIAENNYGYTGPVATEHGGRTAPGIERVDINSDGSGCHVVWLNLSERIPTVVSKLSLASGLVYTYTKDDSSPLDPWYFTALDVRTGRSVYKQLAGAGLGYNNNYAPVTIGPDGSAYIGVIGGLVEVRDATPPNVPLATPPAPGPTARRLRLGLSVRRLHGGAVRVSLTGTLGAVRSVTFIAPGYRATLRGRPFAIVLSRRALARGSVRVRAIVVLRGGVRRTLVRTLRGREAKPDR